MRISFLFGNRDHQAEEYRESDDGDDVIDREVTKVRFAAGAEIRREPGNGDG